MCAGGDAKQAIEFAWPKGGQTNFISSEIYKSQKVSWKKTSACRDESLKPGLGKGKNTTQ